VLREGLKLLEERGLVRVEQGRGTTVETRDRWNLLDPTVLRIALEHDADLTLFDDLITVRQLLEAEMARVAASRLSDEDLEDLARDVASMKDALGSYPEFQRLDLHFHSQVMKASANEIARTIVNSIHQYARRTPHNSAPGERAALETTVRAHESILEALVARDGDLAARRVAEHIGTAWAERRALAAH
jgi:DNA-binding FadR family transcriptional regulator